MLKKLQKLIEEADPETIQKEITKGSDTLPIDKPLPGKIYNSVDDALDDYLKLFNEIDPGIKVKIERVLESDDDERQIILTVKDENFEYREKFDRFISSRVFKAFKKSLSDLNIEQTQLDMLSSIEKWNIDETQAPKYIFAITINLSQMR